MNQHDPVAYSVDSSPPAATVGQPRRRFLLWLSSLGVGAALVGIWTSQAAQTEDSSTKLEPGRAGHDPCLDPGAPRGRTKELT